MMVRRRGGKEMAAKRADYFAAGTLVVWDVVYLLGRGGGGVYRARETTAEGLQPRRGGARPSRRRGLDDGG